MRHHMIYNSLVQATRGRRWRELPHLGQPVKESDVMRMLRLLVAAMLIAWPALAQSPKDPFPKPIPAVDGANTVNFVEFATIPDISGEAPRMMLILDEPGTKRLFVNTMRGPLYSVS